MWVFLLLSPWPDETRRALPAVAVVLRKPGTLPPHPFRLLWQLIVPAKQESSGVTPVLPEQLVWDQLIHPMLPEPAAGH